MTIHEIAKELRPRLIKEFADRINKTSDYRLLQDQYTCDRCYEPFVPRNQLVRLAAEAANVDDWIQKMDYDSRLGCH